MDVLLSHEVSPSTLVFLRAYFNADPLLFGILNDPANPVWHDIGRGPERTRQGSWQCASG